MKLTITAVFAHEQMRFEPFCIRAHYSGKVELKELYSMYPQNTDSMMSSMPRKTPDLQLICTHIGKSSEKLLLKLHICEFGK